MPSLEKLSPPVEKAPPGDKDNVLGRSLSIKQPVISPSRQPTSLGDFLSEFYFLLIIENKLNLLPINSFKCVIVKLYSNLKLVLIWKTTNCPNNSYCVNVSICKKRLQKTSL